MSDDVAGCRILASRKCVYFGRSSNHGGVSPAAKNSCPRHFEAFLFRKKQLEQKCQLSACNGTINPRHFDMN